MSEGKDEFFNKLYAIQPFKETVSPHSSAQKEKKNEEMHFGGAKLEFKVPDEPSRFLADVAPLRKIHSEQPVIFEMPDLTLGESNRKTMTSISSTIDILFSKIEKIKE
jgi:hypothetical protein